MVRKVVKRIEANHLKAFERQPSLLCSGHPSLVPPEAGSGQSLPPQTISDSSAFIRMSSQNAPAHSSSLATNQSFASQGLSPRQIVSAYDAGQWEEFINEWTQGLKSEYAQVQRFSGAGDKGRDVVGFLGVPVSSSAWDNYQCKHYKRPLNPSDIWIELGKLCYFTFVGDYTIPRKYRFVAPNDVGPKLKDLLLKPNELRNEFIANWAEHCAKEITDTKPIPLEGKLLEHVNQFDFSIVGYSRRVGRAFSAKHPPTR